MQPSTIAQIVICTVALPCVAVEPMAIDDYAVECDSLFNYVGPGNEVTRYWKLTDDDFRQIAVELGIEVATIRAVVEIEAGTHHTGFYAPMKPIINFDRTIFRSRAMRAGISTAKPKEQAAIAMAPVNSRKYGSYALAQQARLNAARQIDPVIANESTFWGMFQIGGFNWHKCGMDSVDEFVAAMCYSEAMQLELFARFIKNSGMLKYLQAKNWRAFARAYNGPSYARRGYHTRLARAYAKYSEAAK